ncbi:MAG TPA: hypothetical protein VL463_10615 [Kofleriaceae bacterium]|nr:hypothetical protein [Kofleriaceae bacterium]
MPGPAAPAAAAGGGAPGPAANPQQLIAQHAAQSGAANPADTAIITRVETAIAHSPMGWLQSLLGESSSKADADRSAAEEKAGDMRTEVANHQSDAPADAGPPPQPGSPVHPNVQQPAAAGQGQAGAPARPGPQAQALHPPGKGGAHARGAGGGASVPAGAATALAAASTEADFNAVLNNYPNKSTETTGQLGRIKQMGDIARGFQGQLDTYVAHGSGAMATAFAGAVNFLGAGKDVNAIWDNNPYRKSNDTLGHIMTGLSAIKHVVSIVGSICGKIGLILTVVGLLGMIFPPIGTAVSGIARVLNVVGIICDAISFVLSAILTGLNGVRLAKQIASHGSAEEKAATADLMMSEANDAAGSAISLAMAFGPKFMKGLMQKSQGVINGLLRRMKAFVGNIMTRISGTARGFATRVMRSLPLLNGAVKMRLVNGVWQAEKGGIGAAIRASRVGQLASRVGGGLSTAWNAPGRAITRTREYLMNRFGTSSFALGAERFGARAGALADRMDITKIAESAGERVGNIGAGTARAQAMQEAAQAAERRNLELQASQAARDAEDLERRRLQYEMQQRQAAGANPKRDMEGNNDFMNHGGRQQRRINQAGQAAADEVRDGERLATSNAAQDAANAANHQGQFAGDQQGYMQQVSEARTNVRNLEAQYAAQEAERRALLKRGESALGDAEKTRLAQLNGELSSLDAARNRAAIYDERLYAMASGGGTRAPQPQNVKEVGAAGAGAWKAGNAFFNRGAHSWDSKESFDFKDPLKWNRSSAAGNAAGRGGHGDFGAIATESAQGQRNDFHNFVQRQPQAPTVVARVRSMLANVGHRNQQGAQGGGVPATPPTVPTSAPTNQQAPNAQANAPASTPAPTSTPTPAPAGGGTPAPQPVATGGGNGAQQIANQAPAANGGAAPPGGADPHAATPAPAQAEPQPQGGEGGAGDPGANDQLPYWPKLLDQGQDGTFANALQEFDFMRRVAVEFKRAQDKGKQEAVDTLATYGRYQEYAHARQAAATQHQNDTHATGQETVQAQAAAQNSQQSGDQGAQKQNEARGTNSPTPDIPEPESHGFWGRIIGRIKRWAKSKAAAIFGWIQEKIASLILQGLCGVSMGDLKDYAGALHRQQQGAQGVADQGANTAGQAAQANVTLSGNVAKEAQDAANSITQCDANIAEADRFIGDVNTFEQQVRASAAAAQAFINSIHADWQAQRAQANEAAQQAQNAPDGGAPGADASAPAPAPDAGTPAPAGGGTDQSTDPNMCGPDDPQMSANPPAAPAGPPADDHADPSDIADIHMAASYVGSAAEGAVHELEATKTDYHNQLVAASTNRGKGGRHAIDTAQTNADGIVTGFRRHMDEIKHAMETISGRSSIPSSEVTSLVEAIITSATDLDHTSQDAHQRLTQAFEGTYNTVKTMQPDNGMVGNMINRVNDAAAPLEGAAQRGIDAAQPHADAAFNATANVVTAVADPVANTAVTAASMPIRATAYAGATVVGGMANPPPGTGDVGPM